MWTSTQSDKMFGLQQHSSVRSIEGEYPPVFLADYRDEVRGEYLGMRW